MSKSHIFSLLLASIYLSSCIRMGDNGYQQLSDSQKSKIVTCTSPIDSLCYDGNIYLVSIEQMREHVNRHKTLVIYEFGAYCHGDNCISPQMAESICREKGYDFCLLLDGYDYLLQFPATKVPVLAPNPSSYGLKPTKSCIERMLRELSGNKLGKDDYGRFYVFEGGQYVSNLNSLKTLGNAGAQ